MSLTGDQIDIGSGEEEVRLRGKLGTRPHELGNTRPHAQLVA